MKTDEAKKVDVLRSENFVIWEFSAKDLVLGVVRITSPLALPIQVGR
jgi:hypothetical protein